LEKITISIDAMGGDYGPTVTVPAAFKLLTKYPNVQLILVGNQEILKPIIVSCYGNSGLKDRITVQHASEEVLMDELPSKALRGKKDSSMRVAINLVKDGTANACVSSGNTGALVATARFVLKTLQGIDRPAITTRFPTMIPNKSTNILDLGANIDSKADYLCQLAVMGSVLSSVIDNNASPKVALLNIGSEEIKGNEQIKEAARLLAKNKNINYVGFIEGDDLFKGNIDVVVCDGFIGNIVLKTIEGALKLVSFYAKRNMMRNLFTKLTTILALPMLRGLQRDIDPGKYNGATLVGLQGVVIKSHGGANTTAFFYALEKAVIEAEKNVPQAIRDELSRIFKDTAN
jgi:glycerol-3-phosphate acyltransferase PlsX